MARAQHTNLAARTGTARTTKKQATRTGTTANRNMNQAKGQANANRNTQGQKKIATSATTAAGTGTRQATTAKKQTAGKTGGKQTKAQREAASSLTLTPIRKRQTPAQIIATVAADTGVEPRTVERVARSLSTTLTRHLIRNGSGRVEIPYLKATLWRGQQAASKARTMFSPILKREVQIPARKAQPVPRLRIHPTFRETVART